MGVGGVQGVRSFKKGNLTADGTEQVLLEFSGTGKVSGYVSLENMGAGDTVVIKQYMKINGDYKEYAQETYTGVQTVPLIHITPKAIGAFLKTTLQQTVGIFKSFRYNFMRET